MRCLLVLAPLLLAACAGGTVGPSLAKRPIESRSFEEPVREAAPLPPAGPDLRSQIDGFVNRARAGQRAFADLLPRVRRAAASAGIQGSESWISAQQLISALEGTRDASVGALTRLDAMLAERVLARNEAGLAELQAAQREIADIVAAQQQNLDQVRARVSG